jgi:hypothetical protein
LSSHQIVPKRDQAVEARFVLAPIRDPIHSCGVIAGDVTETILEAVPKSETLRS